MSLPRTEFKARRTQLFTLHKNKRAGDESTPLRLRNLSAFHSARKPHVRKHYRRSIQHICGVSCTFHHANLLSNVKLKGLHKIKATRYRRVRGYGEKIKDDTATLAKLFHPVY